MPRSPQIGILVSLDTKGAEAEFLKKEIQRNGGKAILVDFGTHGSSIGPDVPATHIAAAAGHDLDELVRAGERSAIIDAMMEGAAKWAQKAHSTGTIDGLISVGGSGGTAVGTAAMRALPFGVPKVMVSTVASGDVRSYVGTRDIAMINSVVDFAGVNPISEPILRNAAAAVTGMARAAMFPVETSDQILVAASQFGVTTQAVEQCAALLARAGVALVPFHATGIGGQTMESLIDDGKFAAVLDLTTTEWADEVVGGSLSAGPDRLGAAARKALPQVVAPGALDMVNFFQVPVPDHFKGRTIHNHNANVALMRTTPDENVEIARRIASQLNKSDAPVSFLFPLKGISALDQPDQPFYDPEANEALRATLRANLSGDVEFIELDLHINDAEFARQAVAALLRHVKTEEVTANA